MSDLGGGQCFYALGFEEGKVSVVQAGLCLIITLSCLTQLAITIRMCTITCVLFEWRRRRGMRGKCVPYPLHMLEMEAVEKQC